MFHIHLYPESRLLFQILFSLATGPVTFAIMAWRNSLVFHSLDRLTTVAVHAFPPLMIYIMRWCATLRRMSPAHAAPLRSCLDDRAASFSAILNHPAQTGFQRKPRVEILTLEIQFRGRAQLYCRCLYTSTGRSATVSTTSRTLSASAPPGQAGSCAST